MDGFDDLDDTDGSELDGLLTAYALEEYAKERRASGASAEPSPVSVVIVIVIGCMALACVLALAQAILANFGLL
jgi:hypothetical protein